MECRLLEKREHEKTRVLWEEVFWEDTKKFLDYYYTFVTDHNHIYVIEEEDLRSMLHLNPYKINVKEKEFLLHYIVAVSTREQYRGQGYMRKLLKRSFQDMYERKEPFTYLMPAKEAIYEPFGFVTVSEQAHYKVKKEEFFEKLEEVCKGCHITEILEKDCKELAAFSQRILSGEYEIFTTHTEAYFRQLIKEQQCQSGGIYGIRNQGEIKGYFLLADEGYTQVRELVSEKELGLVLEIKDQPKIMVRPIHMETFLGLFADEEEVQVVDEVIMENTGVYVRCKDSKEGYVKREKEIEEQKALKVDELTRKYLEKNKILINEIV